jgi:hypothetical protein
MSVAPAGSTSMIVAVSGVLQDPSTYAVVGTALNFSVAPPAGTGNISVRYLGIPATGVTTTAYRTATEFTATAGQTTFTPPSYTVGYLDVYRNGVLLGSADYTASNGTTVVLAVGAVAGDLVETISFLVSSVLNAIPNTSGSISSTNLPAGLTISSPTLSNATATGTLTTSSSGVTFSDGSNQTAAASPYVLKNRIINGAMVISQRNGTSSVATTTAGSNTYTLDRWLYNVSQASKFTIQQNAGSVTPPIGFSNYQGITSTSAYTVGAAENFLIGQFIEGFNSSDLGWGTANAKTVTLSFQVRSSLTGTFGGSIVNSAFDRSYPFSYSIPVANTWTTVSVTIAGDTSGTWIGSTNGIGIRVYFSLGVGASISGTAGAWAASGLFSATGAVSVVGTSGATFYITGVQLEQNTSATPFERRLYNQELANCQRYYITVGGDTTNQTFTMMQAYSTTAFNGGTVPFPVKMRTIPTFSYSSLAHFYAQNSVGGAAIPTAIQQNGSEASTMCGAIAGSVASGLTAGNASNFLANSINARLNFSAEL